MTQHPCKGMSAAAIKAFEAVATGDALPSCNRKTMANLVKRGVVVKGEDKVLRDEFGSFAIPQYYVPLQVHIAWCAWCSEQHGSAIMSDDSKTEAGHG
jgi:hypothetical protein